MWDVYVLKDSTGRHYIGLAEDLRRRLKEHQSGSTQTTRRMKDLELVYYEAGRSKTDAALREKQLKTGFGRAYLKRRLYNDNMGP